FIRTYIFMLCDTFIPTYLHREKLCIFSLMHTNCLCFCLATIDPLFALCHFFTYACLTVIYEILQQMTFSKIPNVNKQTVNSSYHQMLFTLLELCTIFHSRPSDAFVNQLVLRLSDYIICYVAD